LEGDQKANLLVREPSRNILDAYQRGSPAGGGDLGLQPGYILVLRYQRLRRKNSISKDAKNTLDWLEEEKAEIGNNSPEEVTFLPLGALSLEGRG